MRRWLLGATVVAVMVAGCGDPAISPEASAALGEDLAALRAAVETQDAPGAQGLLEELLAEAARQVEAGEITPERHARIEAAAGHVARLLADLQAAEPAQESEPEPEPQPEPEPDQGAGKDKDKDKGEGNGKGKG